MLQEPRHLLSVLFFFEKQRLNFLMKRVGQNRIDLNPDIIVFVDQVVEHNLYKVLFHDVFFIFPLNI